MLSHSEVSDSLRPHELQPTRLLCPWNSLGKNIEAGCHSLLHGDLPDPGIELLSLASPARAGGFFTTEPPRKTDYNPDDNHGFVQLLLLNID